MENNLLLEKQLIERCRNGESAAFSQLVKIYRRQLFTYLWKLCGDKSEAEDLFQETLIKAWKGIGRYRHEDKFSSWLFSIAHNAAMDSHRKNKVRMNVFVTDELRAADYNNPHTQLVANELRGILDEAINSLPEKQKQVFLLREHGDMTFKEIAETTNEPLNTVLGHMHYAVSKLKKALRIKNVI
ncbi:MAG: RNA polymerase sigma factor [Bacillota bacterium]